LTKTNAALWEPKAMRVVESGSATQTVWHPPTAVWRIQADAPNFPGNVAMKTFTVSMCQVVAGIVLMSAMGAAQAQSCPAWLNQSQPRLQDDKPQALCQYSGKVLLVVNTASYCGFTPQYKALEALQSRLADKGFTVLGFPSNDFAQEPGSGKDIAEFCENTYGVKFPMFAKSSVTGKTANPVFAYLSKTSGSSPRWNFHKYLISRDGATVLSFGSMTSPDDPKLVAELEKMLAQPAPKPASE
jgi:glutathione peroxidase